MQLNHLESTKKQLKYYKHIAEKTFSQLEEEQLFWQYNENSNSISIIVQHMAGNMLSRWTDIFNSDGEKTWRNRESEFEKVITNKTQLIEKWESGWNCFFNTLESLTEEDLSRIIYIRNEGQTLLDALYRQLAHYPYHIGQIVFLGKMVCDKNWEALTIPKGKSNIYNKEKFSGTKILKNFTEDFLDNSNE